MMTHHDPSKCVRVYHGDISSVNMSNRRVRDVSAKKLNTARCRCLGTSTTCCCQAGMHPVSCG